MKDTFYTIAYKGQHIHGCYNRETQREEIQYQIGFRTFPAKSLHAAKCKLTRALPILSK